MHTTDVHNKIHIQASISETLTITPHWEERAYTRGQGVLISVHQSDELMCSSHVWLYCTQIQGTKMMLENICFYVKLYQVSRPPLAITLANLVDTLFDI